MGCREVEGFLGGFNVTEKRKPLLFVDINARPSRMLQQSGDPSLELHRLQGGVTLRV